MKHVWTTWSRGLVQGDETMTRWGSCPGCHHFYFDMPTGTPVMINDMAMGPVALKMAEHARNCPRYEAFVRGYYQGRLVGR